MAVEPEVVPLGSITSWESGGTPDRLNRSYWAGSVPWISASTLKTLEISDSPQRVTPEAVRTASNMAPVGATLILVRGMALHREVRAGIVTSPVCFNQDIKALLPTPRVLPRYLTYSIHARSKQILDLVSSAGSGTGVLDTTVLKQLPVWLPTRHHQAAVVDALDDVERHIVMLGRLIAKKQAIKHGMMQQLLTGRTRLPGFQVPWDESTVESVALIVSGGTPKSSVAAYWDGSIAWCTQTDITGAQGRYLRTTARTISHAGLESSAAQLLPAGAVLLCTRATIGAVKIALCPVATNQGFKSLVPKPGMSNTFLYYKILTLTEELAGYGTGSTFLEVSKRDVAGLEIETPTFKEQEAIAGVLSDTDDEIDTLHARLTKAKAVKQGMMQELLTGRTRLPVPAADRE